MSAHQLLVLVSSAAIGGLWVRHRHDFIDWLTRQAFLALHRHHCRRTISGSVHRRSTGPWR